MSDLGHLFFLSVYRTVPRLNEVVYVHLHHSALEGNTNSINEIAIQLKINICSVDVVSSYCLYNMVNV